jgi:A/G-specific adenine glycosylase
VDDRIKGAVREQVNRSRCDTGLPLGPPPHLAADLLAWYRRHARDLPWRAKPGQTADPYRVWLSEIMLQQTTVAAVAPYFRAFLARWPEVRALAAAPLEDVLAAWAGLGYYARARNLHACARAVAERHGGRFPETEAELRKLPGIGAYTGAAIAAIAFGQRASVVDGNVERVVARLFALETPLPRAKPELRALAASLLPPEPAPDFPYGDFAQATMDLGATICLPRKPRCVLCPLRGACAAQAAGIAADLPRRTPKKTRPTRRGAAFWLIRDDGAVLLRRRAARCLLGGMMEVPGGPWVDWPGVETDPDPAQDLSAAPAAAAWKALPGQVSHTFTHFHLDLIVWAARLPESPSKGPAKDGIWVPPEALSEIGLPSVMAKVARHALHHFAPAKS